MDPRIDKLQDLTARLRHGAAVDVTRVIRKDGAIVGAEKRTVPFDPVKALREGEQLNAGLNAAGLAGDEAIIYLAALSDFIEAAEPHAAAASRPGLRGAHDQARSALHAAGVRL